MEASSLEEVQLYHEEHCDGAVSAFKRDLGKVKTGRASAGIVEGIVVDYYGAKTALQHLAQVSTPDATTIHIQVYDSGAVTAVEKAIQTSDLGFNPNTEGNVIRISVPPLTEETRKDIVKRLGKMAEDIRVSIRNHRRDANDAIKKLEKDSVITKDDVKRELDSIQKKTDSYIQEIEAQLKTKEEEVLAV